MNGAFSIICELVQKYKNNEASQIYMDLN